MQNESSIENDAFTPISYEVKVGLTVRALRNFFGMSQSDLAELCGVSRPTLSSLEKGNTVRHANAETLEKLLKFFRGLGVVIQIADDEITYTFSKEAVDLAATVTP
jgi:transcriptional regulator with XRE-family HTH domain